MSLKRSLQVLSSEKLRGSVLSILVVFLLVPALLIHQASLIHWAYVVAAAVIVPPLCRVLGNIRARSLNRVFALLLIVYGIAHLGYELLVYETGLRATKDTAAFVQSFWNLEHQGRFLTTIDGQYSGVAPKAISHFARHNSPILFIGYLFYWAFGSMVGLILLKTLALVITGVLAFRLIEDALPSENERSLSALLPFVLLLQVPMLFMTDFDETPFFPPLLMWLALSYKRGDRTQFALASLFFAGVRETAALALVAWAIVAFIARKRILGAIALGVATLSVAVTFGLVFRATSPTGSSPFLAEISASIVAMNAGDLIAYWTKLLAGWAVLPAFSLFTLVAGPELFLNSLFSGTMPWTLDMAGRYQVLPLSVLFLAAIDALPRVARFCADRLHFVDAREYLMSGLLAIVVCSLFQGGMDVRLLWEHLSGDWREDLECISRVPKAEGAVIAEHTISGYFSERPLLWSSRLPLPPETWEKAEWVVGKRHSAAPFTVVGTWDTVCTSADLFVLMKRNASSPVPP